MRRMISHFRQNRIFKIIASSEKVTSLIIPYIQTLPVPECSTWNILIKYLKNQLFIDDMVFSSILQFQKSHFSQKKHIINDQYKLSHGSFLIDYQWSYFFGQNDFRKTVDCLNLTNHLCPHIQSIDVPRGTFRQSILKFY